MGASETLSTRLLSSPGSCNKYTFLWSKIFFAEWIYVWERFVCDTNIFCMKIYFSYIYIYTFIYNFLCKKAFFSKKMFQYKTLFPNKSIFSANNVYFVKNRNIFSKKTFFFSLVLQQMSNHRCYITNYITSFLLIIIVIWTKFKVININTSSEN